MSQLPVLKECDERFVRLENNVTRVVNEVGNLTAEIKVYTGNQHSSDKRIEQLNENVVRLLTLREAETRQREGWWKSLGVLVSIGSLVAAILAIIFK
jgi:archaellum component FlaC